MIEIEKNLFIGDDNDFETIKDDEDFYIIHACKEPYHRQLLGYSGRNCNPTNPEYLYAERDNILYLNMVDAYDKKYIRKNLYNISTKKINDALLKNKKVLIHCNKGESRSPSIGLYYLKTIGKIKSDSYINGKTIFINEYYPNFRPNKGIDEWLEENWNERC